jgi:hypothetical protein
VRGDSGGPHRNLLLCLIDIGSVGRLRLRRCRTMIVTSWAAMIVGTALWGYGLFVTGTAPIIDWKSNAPWWIADYLPNMESELGLVLVCLGSLAPYWPRRP